MWLQNSDVIIEDKRHYLKDICLSRKICSLYFIYLYFIVTQRSTHSKSNQ